MIRKLLVANRGEIALRVMRSARTKGIATVAVFSDPDASAPFVELADEGVNLPGSSPSDTYLRSDLVVDAALRCGADAVHPGYGFLSENANFARACAAAGLVFVGPPADVIEAMGSKLAAKAMMTAAGIPVLPQVEISARNGVAHRGAAGSATPAVLRTDGDLAEAVDLLGFPLLVKASSGGGGRGMRVVEDASLLAGAVESARREALSAFGDDTVFLEPYARSPRHIEVQVVGDLHGNLVHLFERECSIQRRHQKIIEECPSVALDDESRGQLCDMAVTAAKAIGYVNAGTVEFLMLEDGSFAFLEVNTRLQVEHPVTELVTGLDLVHLQLLVAEGGELPHDVRFPKLQGHAIEARLYAEDPTEDWRPSVGHLQRFRIPANPGEWIRVDSGVEDGSVVSPWYDPMLAKIISHAPTRDEAARVLARALSVAQLHGIKTNRELLVRILQHPEFVSGDTDTDFLVRHDPAELGAYGVPPKAEMLHAVAAALAAQENARHSAKVLADLPTAWRNNPSSPQTTSFEGRAGRLDVALRFDRTGRCSEVACTLEPVNSIRDPLGSIDRPPDLELDAGLEVIGSDPSEVILRAGGITKTYSVHRVGIESYIDGPEGSSVLRLVERFNLPGSQLEPGSLVAPLPGTVVRVEVSEGDEVAVGQTLVAIEAMKMEHQVRAGKAGKVSEVAVRPGDQVESGRLLVIIEGIDNVEGER